MRETFFLKSEKKEQSIFFVGFIKKDELLQMMLLLLSSLPSPVLFFLVTFQDYTIVSKVSDEVKRKSGRGKKDYVSRASFYFPLKQFGFFPKKYGQFTLLTKHNQLKHVMVMVG